MKINYFVLLFLAVLHLLIGCTHGNDINSAHRLIRESKYANGQIKSRVWYKNGQIDSLSIWYYENGNIEVIAEYSEGKQVGSTYFFHPIGEIESYYYYNEEGDSTVMFSREYLGDGGIRDIGGTIAVRWKNSPHIKANDYFYFYLLLVEPPDAKRTVFIYKKAENSEYQLYDVFVAREKKPSVKVYFPNSGTYSILVISEINDTIRGSIKRDTIPFMVEVK